MQDSDKLDKNKIRKLYESMENIKKTRIFIDLIDDLKHSEFIIMYMIKNSIKEPNGVKVSEIADMMMISKPAVSQMINIIEDKGYVERITTKTDRRVVYVRLTEIGDKLVERAMKESYRRISKIFDKMGDEDTDTLIRLLDKFYSIILETKENLKKNTEV